MNLENGGSSVLFINTDTAIFSKTSRRAARSHAAALSQTMREGSDGEVENWDEMVCPPMATPGDMTIQLFLTQLNPNFL
jgi:hypothetical protein